MRVEITTPPTSDPVSIAISPDGEKIAFVSSSRGRPMLWVRSIVTGEVRPLPGTDGASFPFWSPDSRSVGFYANERLNRIDIDGGSLRPIAFAPVGAGGTWSRDGDILYTLVPDGPISRVTDVVGQPVRHPGAEGGPRILPGFETGRGGHRFPQFLPDGRRFLYYVLDSGVRGVYVGTLDGPDRRHLFDADAAAVFVPPAEVIYVRAGTLFSQRVDPATLAFEGDAIVLADGVAVDWAGAAAVSASAAGAIVYRRADARLRQLVWVDRSGKTIGEAFPPDSANPLNPALSPDGRRLAVNRTVGGNSDIWVVDLDRRGALAKVTSAPTPDISPIWSPKDDLIVYGGSSTGSFDLWQVSTARPGEPRALLTRPLADVPLDWSRDGRFVLFRSQMDPVTGVDLWALPLDGADRTPIPVARSAADEHSGEFSPDTTWVAIESDETGRREIYLQGFPAAGTKIPLSTSGGTQPRWRPDGKELSYVAPDGQLMAVGLRFGSKGRSVEPTSPVPLFVTRVSSTPPGGSRQEYVLSPDGKRFLMNTLVEQANAPITLILRRRQ
jgi:Tol biopolymer transport system component